MVCCLIGNTPWLIIEIASVHFSNSGKLERCFIIDLPSKSIAPWFSLSCFISSGNKLCTNSSDLPRDCRWDSPPFLHMLVNTVKIILVYGTEVVPLQGFCMSSYNFFLFIPLVKCISSYVHPNGKNVLSSWMLHICLYDMPPKVQMIYFSVFSNTKM